MAEFATIDDAEDPRIAPYRSVRERDLVGRQGLFVAEGAVVLNVLVRQRRHEILSVLLAEKRVAALAPVLARMPEATPVYTASQLVLDAIAGFHIHRGILALGRAAAPPDAATLLDGLSEHGIALVLCGIANHDNMGGIFRNAAAFGVEAVVLDSTCCDPLYRKAIRVSVGGALALPYARLGADEDVLTLLEARRMQTFALSPAGGIALHEVRPEGRVALVLGAEGPGLPAAVLARAATVRIDMAGDFDSLNVATTSGIVLHHLSARRR